MTFSIVFLNIKKHVFTTIAPVHIPVYANKIKGVTINHKDVVGAITVV